MWVGEGEVPAGVVSCTPEAGVGAGPVVGSSQVAGWRSWDLHWG